MIVKSLNSRANKTPGHNSARPIVKLQKINNTLHTHNNKNQTAYNSISSASYNTVERIQKKISINDQILFRRKQNYLNTHYNKRLNALKQITKENKKIYERINSQKSLYSQDSMRKSSTSLRSLSRSNSRVSNQSKNSQNKNKLSKNSVSKPQKNDNITIQPETVNKIKQQNLNQFKSMFLRQKKAERPLKGHKVQNRSVSLRSEPKTNNEKMGNMLHKIAEQMYQRPDRKKLLQNRKILS